MVVDARALQPVLRAVSGSGSNTGGDERDVVLGNALQALPAVRESLAAAGISVLPSPSSSTSLTSGLDAPAPAPASMPSQPPQHRRRGSSSSASSSSLSSFVAGAGAASALQPLAPEETAEQVRGACYTYTDGRWHDDSQHKTTDH